MVIEWAKDDKGDGVEAVRSVDDAVGARVEVDKAGASDAAARTKGKSGRKRDRE